MSDVSDRDRLRGITQLRGEMYQEMDPEIGTGYVSPMYNARRAAEGVGGPYQTYQPPPRIDWSRLNEPLGELFSLRKIYY